MSLSDPIITVLAPFRPLFSPATWTKVQLLLVGTILVRGRRTVAAALRVMGHARDSAFSRYHQVLNRASWSAFAASRVLLLLLVRTLLAPDAPVQVVIDEFLERRWGPKILKRGHYRDPLLSGKGRAVSTSGLCWITCMLLVPLPWTDSVWALPFLSILTTPPADDKAVGRRHKTVGMWAAQVVILLRRWLPERGIVLLGDGHYSIIDLGITCVRQRVRLVTPLELDANLFAPPAPRRPGQRGAPRVKGAALPKLAALLDNPATPWRQAALPWYAVGTRVVEWCSGQALWYHGGKTPLPIRWVLTRDPRGRRPPHAYLQTELSIAAIPLAGRPQTELGGDASPLTSSSSVPPPSPASSAVPAAESAAAVAVAEESSAPPSAPSVVAASAPATAEVAEESSAPPSAPSVIPVPAPAAAGVAEEQRAPPPASSAAPAAGVAAASAPAEAAPLILGADAAAGRELIAVYQLRWRVEVTLEESRAHLGVETQRQWSKLAVLRSTPGLLGLFSLVVLLALALHPDGVIPVAKAAWYPKRQATFSDVLATVRRHLWRRELFDRPLAGAEQIILSRADLDRVMQAAAA